eukprot:GFKZ01010594.1.p1 GENE.GFKZ01010594.1~~GFKZ01010594.1.p1  ORF type:complete len:730 (-),score=126.31 GFKZ01010594.1:341-2530(-)
MSYEADPWKWSWYGPGTPDKKPGRGRVYYKGVEAFRRTDNMKRIYNVGDTVNMIGEEHQVWTAQLVDLFQVEPDDEDLRRILRHDSRRATGDARYEYMRCTLRWFYNPEDMKQETLRRSSVPKQIRHEIYFSDHVEISGFNSITVIDGLAWVFPSKHERDRWLREPDVRYKPSLDIIRIVRTFVNSASPDLTVRELDSGELNYHIKNPTAEKNLFDTGRQRARGKFSAASSIVRPSMKTVGSSTSKKRKRTARAPINIPDDDDDESDYENVPLDNLSNKREPKIEDDVENVGRTKGRHRREKRRKVIVDDDDDDAYVAVDAEDRIEPAISSASAPKQPPGSSDLVAKQRAELQEAQDEVWDMINELNQNAASFDPQKGSSEAKHTEEDVITPVSVGTKELEKADSAEGGKQLPQRRKPTPSSARRALQGTAASKSSALRRSQSGAMQRKSSASSALKKTTSNSKVIIIDEDLDSDEGLKRMLPSITPRRTRIREVSDNSLDHAKQRAQFASTARERKAMREGRETQPKGRQHQVVKSRDISNEVGSVKNLNWNTSHDSAKDGSKEKATTNVEKEIESRGMGLAEIAAKSNPANERPVHSAKPREVEPTRVVTRAEQPNEEVEVDWWKETNKVLQTLKMEFQRMTPVCQQLFRNHFDDVFDLTVQKVTSNGFYGKIDGENEHLRGMVGEIISDLREMVLSNRSERAHSVERLAIGSSAKLDTLDSARGVV